jgi:dTDP-4-dehydrorhamnose reductase
MKILLTGASGYVGKLLESYLVPKYEVTGVDITAVPENDQLICDLSDADAVTHLARTVMADVVIHVAGNKNIGFCEEHPVEAFQINCDAVKNVASAFGKSARIIYVSTDYVFDGQKGGYREDDLPSPLTVYGKSKLCGETEGRRIAGKNFVTVRLSALYDTKASFPNFLQTQLSAGEPVECYEDVIYSPTYYSDFLEAIDMLVQNKELTGPVYHLCGEATTRYGFALAYAEIFGFNVALVKASSAPTGGKYLFPNLSLNGEWSNTQLRARSTGIREALTELQKENQ